MRLDSEERKALQRALEDVEGPVYLFGSRLNEDGRGGDVDVMIISDSSPLKLACDVAVTFNMECEEKIDVVVIPRSESKRSPEQRAFLNTIEGERIK